MEPRVIHQEERAGFRLTVMSGGVETFGFGQTRRKVQVPPCATIFHIASYFSDGGERETEEAAMELGRQLLAQYAE